MKFEVLRVKQLVDFSVENVSCHFHQGKIVLKHLSPKCHHILHTEVHNQQRNLSPGAHSGGNLV